jgi:hypothetical protein
MYIDKRHFSKILNIGHHFPASARNMLFIEESESSVSKELYYDKQLMELNKPILNLAQHDYNASEILELN